MDLNELKKQYVAGEELGIDSSYGRILTIVDFGNVDYWFEEDTQDADNKAIPEDEKLSIDLEKLSKFIAMFSNHARFYYGHDPQNASLRFMRRPRRIPRL